MVDDVTERPRHAKVDQAKTPSKGDSKQSGGGDGQREDHRFRNRTPDRLRLRNAQGGEFVFAPLEEKKYRPRNGQCGNSAIVTCLAMIHAMKIASNG